MKVVIFLALVATAAAGVVPAHYAAPVLAGPAVVAAPGIVSTGASSQTRSQDGLGNYAFAYKESHGTGGTSRSESGNALGQVVGSYSLGVVDGRQRVVNYVADAAGFRASIASNEPGTAPMAPAATAISAPDSVGIAAATARAAAPTLAGLAAPAYAHAPIVAGPHAAPIVAAPAYGPAYAHAPLVAAAPAVSSYSSVVSHAGIPYAAPIKTVVGGIAAPAFYGHY
ncbi:uncharacterized protein LOC141853119 isoform X1 [Brevipalpus obovatus]|uniref:uncharacterized protein LOC141853119 isoform X1 n=1 Tax=Brevipalpus obovatus TaxID=246614 RepID=UPI003D9EF925